MGFFWADGIKEYRAIASINSGRVAILLETRNGKNSPAEELAVIVDKPRQFSIRMNELKFFKKAFNNKFPQKDECTYCKFAPVNEEFDISDDFIKLKKTGRQIPIKKVSYYEGLLDR
jgi:hypothetical protein